MSDESKENEMQSWIEPELEARVVAWVLGEASGFEAAELERIIGEKPELGIFKRRMETVHGLLGAASRMEMDPMRMAEERRRKLLERLGKAGGGVPEVVVAIREPEVRRRISWSMVAGSAACVVVALLASIMMPAFSNVGTAARKQIEQEKLAELATAGHAGPDTPPTITLARPMPQSGLTAAPAQTERLAALESLKSMARNQTDDLDDAKKFKQETRLAAAQYDQRGGVAGGMQRRVFQEDTLAKNDQVNEARAPGAPTDAPLTLSGEKMLAGATALRGGGMAMGGAVAGEADDSMVAAAPPMTPAGPVAATAAPASLSMPEEAAAMAAPAQSQLADLQQPTRQLQHAAVFANSSAKNDFGMAREADATGTTVMAGQLAMNDDGVVVEKAEGSLGLSKDRLALSVPARADADSAAKPMQPAQRPIGRLAVPGSDEVSASDQPYSTFSLHVSDVSFLLAKAALGNGELPERDSVRPEEFYNAFDYGDPAPGPGEKIACRIEQAAHPMLQQRNLIRIAMKVAATGRGQGQPLRLTVLLDTSGSMEREDRAASVQRAMGVLTSLLGPNDAVTLIGFARQARLLAEEVPGNQAGKLVDIVKRTPPEGGTNMEEALKTASELALRHYEANAQNRVVMLTDGAANLGDADPGQLSLLVEKLRQRGVSFDACGVGADGLNDDVLEALTRKGGGRYYFLNKPEDADEGFARQLAGAFRPAAENVKMQVRFNPERVGKYRLIGFEKHRLKQEDFRNDKVTAAQLAAEEAAVALYQVQVLPEGDGEIGEVFVRFRDPGDGRMVEQSWTIPYDAQAPALDKAAPSMQLAATSALLAEKLRGGAAGDAVDLDALEPMAARLRGEFPEQGRVKDLVGMFEEARRMAGRK